MAKAVFSKSLQAAKSLSRLSWKYVGGLIGKRSIVGMTKDTKDRGSSRESPEQTRVVKWLQAGVLGDLKTGEPVALTHKMAVRVGFEPTEAARPQRFSRPPDSTTLAPHRVFLLYRTPGSRDVASPTFPKQHLAGVFDSARPHACQRSALPEDSGKPPLTRCTRISRGVWWVDRFADGISPPPG